MNHRDVLTFTFPLPFHIGLPSGTLYDLPINEDGFCQCTSTRTAPFTRIVFLDRFVECDEYLPPDIAAWYDPFGSDTQDKPEKMFEVDFRTTRVWLETLALPLASEDHTCGEDVPFGWYPGFRRCLAALNEVLTAYGNATLDGDVYELDGRDVGYYVSCGLRNEDGKLENQSGMLFNFDTWAGRIDSPVTPDNLYILMGRLDDMRVNHPFLRCRVHRRKAHYLRFGRGDRIGAVLSCAMATETLLYDLRRMLALDKRSLPPASGEEIPFAKVIRSELPRLLGGNWQSGPVARFWVNLYSLRNRVIHSGYSPTDGEALDALAAYDEFKDFILERLIVNWRQYPRTLVTLGTMDVSVGAKDKEEFENLKSTIFAEPCYWLDDESKDAASRIRRGGTVLSLSTVTEIPPLFALLEAPE